MNNTIEFKNLHWDYSWNSEGVREDIEHTFSKIANELTKEYTVSCVIVVVKKCDENGSYDTMDIHAYADFISANTLINEKMYSNDAVDVYHYRCSSNIFTNVMSKCYDGCNYSRLAGVSCSYMFDDQLPFRMRHVFDMKSTNVTLHKMEL